MSLIIPEGHSERMLLLGVARFVAVDDLAALAELAEEHGVTTRAVTYWLARPDAPEPLIELSVGRIYSRTQVRQWRSRSRRERNASSSAKAQRAGDDGTGSASEATEASQ